MTTTTTMTNTERPCLRPLDPPRIAIALACLIAASALAGCGEDDRIPVHPASGLVSVDGRPVGGVEVRLYPDDRPGDLDAPRPYATTDDDGRFVLGTFGDGDGAPAGSYRITLFWPDVPPGPTPPNDRLGGRYANPEQTDFRADIAEGANDLGTLSAESAPGSTPSRADDADPDGFGPETMP